LVKYRVAGKSVKAAAGRIYISLINLP